MEEGSHSCWSDGGRASGVAASEPVAKHERVWFWIRGPFWINPAQPPEILVGLLVNSLDEENATCLPAFFVGPGLNAFSAMTALLFPSTLTTETQQFLPSLRETVYMF